MKEEESGRRMTDRIIYKNSFLLCILGFCFVVVMFLSYFLKFCLFSGGVGQSVDHLCVTAVIQDQTVCRQNRRKNKVPVHLPYGVNNIHGK